MGGLWLALGGITVTGDRRVLRPHPQYER